ncbi:hypothetical protein DPMN_011949 [Dreissena polymorpha]|uniref:Uncharacterized protein n=1 Tax=Dreissena polymorpha TaxID=45954 RepID=A0A9D4S2X9_DREPO|nr:hypothetical protein DPMN_011949 [Dreissena polymorpha]
MPPTRYCWFGSLEYSRCMKRPISLCSSAKSSGSSPFSGWSFWSCTSTLMMDSRLST